MTQEYPGAFARFYDLIYHSVRDRVDTAWFLNEIKQAKGKVLEIGAGTGRLFSNALKDGADIYGIDISSAMLEILRKKLNPDQYFRVSRQNMIDFSFDFRFDLIIAPFRVIMHLISKDDQVKAINNVFRHLNTNGKFIFDTFIPDLSMLIKGLENSVDFEGEYEPGKKIKRTVTTRPDLINQIINITFRIDWDEEGEMKTEIWNVPLRYFFRFEMEHLVERSEFRNYRITGDFDGSELSNDSREFIVICNRH